MKWSRLILILVLSFWVFVSPDHKAEEVAQPSQDPTPTFTCVPSLVAIITSTPTPTEIVDLERDVFVSDCESDRWWLEIYYDLGIYDELIMVGIEYEQGIINFYLGSKDGDWELICWVYG